MLTPGSDLPEVVEIEHTFANTNWDAHTSNKHQEA